MPKPMTTVDAIRELMHMWDVSRARWVETFGTDVGFSDWFSRQVGVSGWKKV